MSRHVHHTTIRASLLERLLEQTVDASRAGMSARDASLAVMKQAVRGDLETLLNTRNPFFDLSGAFIEAGRSVLTYGLPDLSTFNVVELREAHRLRQAVESAIRTFEPRLTGVTVALAPVVPTNRTFSLRIDARLVVDPAPEPIRFDVVVPPGSAACQVSEVADA